MPCGYQCDIATGELAPVTVTSYEWPATVFLPIGTTARTQCRRLAQEGMIKFSIILGVLGLLGTAAAMPTSAGGFPIGDHGSTGW